jgi:hypothetical protein
VPAKRVLWSHKISSGFNVVHEYCTFDAGSVSGSSVEHRFIRGVPWNKNSMHLNRTCL